MSTILDTIKQKYNEYTEKIYENKITIYPPLLFIYFLLYFSFFLNDLSDSTSKEGINHNFSNTTGIIVMLVFDVLIVAGISYGIFYLVKNNIMETLIKKWKILIYVGIFFIALLFGLFNNLVFISGFADSMFAKIIYQLFLTVFFIILIVMFFKELFISEKNTGFNIEALMIIFLLIMYFINYTILSSKSIAYINKLLKSLNLSLLSENCFLTSSVEKFNSETGVQSTNQSPYFAGISKKYGENYLKLSGNIPISFLNSTSKTYQNLTLADFYYPGSYYTYLAESPYNGVPNMNAIKNALVKFKCRFIHLDLYSSSNSYGDPKAKAVVKCKDMKDGAEALDFAEVLSLINKYAWITSDDNTSSYPLFLYLNFNFEENEYIYFNIYNNILKVFAKYLLNKKYGFAGRNGTFPMSKIPMVDAIGKIVLITNNYPTRTVLDEIINSTSNNLDHFFNLQIYKSSYVEYENLGLSVDNNKNTLVTTSKSNMSFYYTLPTETNDVKTQVKSGLYNPSFQDCAQYGIQGTLMYLFVPDNNLNKWYNYFKNTNNFNPVLKDESLRFVGDPSNEITPQDPVYGLTPPQKYCVIPGDNGMSTEKSNINGNPVNNTCK
jgi:hypothetical protein